MINITTVSFDLSLKDTLEIFVNGKTDERSTRYSEAV